MHIPPGHLICFVISLCFLLSFLHLSKMMLSQEKIQRMEYSKEGRVRWKLWLGLTPTPRAPSLVSFWLAEGRTPHSCSYLLAGRKDTGMLGLFPCLQLDGDCSPKPASRAPCSALPLKPHTGCKLGSAYNRKAASCRVISQPADSHGTGLRLLHMALCRAVSKKM